MSAMHNYRCSPEQLAELKLRFENIVFSKRTIDRHINSTEDIVRVLDKRDELTDENQRIIDDVLGVLPEQSQFYGFRQPSVPVGFPPAQPSTASLSPQRKGLNRVYDLIGRELGKWKVFARALDISESELNDLENIKSTQERVRQMLAMHENRCDPRNWRNTLIEALIRARRNDLRRRVEEELNRFHITAPP